MRNAVSMSFLTRLLLLVLTAIELQASPASLASPVNTSLVTAAAAQLNGRGAATVIDSHGQLVPIEDHQLLPDYEAVQAPASRTLASVSRAGGRGGWSKKKKKKEDPIDFLSPHASKEDLAKLDEKVKGVITKVQVNQVAIKKESKLQATAGKRIDELILEDKNLTRKIEALVAKDEDFGLKHSAVLHWQSESSDQAKGIIRKQKVYDGVHKDLQKQIDKQTKSHKQLAEQHEVLEADLEAYKEENTKHLYYIAGAIGVVLLRLMYSFCYPPGAKAKEEPGEQEAAFVNDAAVAGEEYDFHEDPDAGFG